MILHVTKIACLTIGPKDQLIEQVQIHKQHIIYVD